MSNTRGRRIETEKDVENVLNSDAVSFAEYMDCVAVGRSVGRWDLVERAGEGALAQELNRPKLNIPSLEQAARVVADACLGRAKSLDGLPAAIKAAEQMLADATAQVNERGHSPPGEWTAGTRYWLEELRLLFADPTVPSYTKLCAELRKIDRADLGIEAATRALDLDPKSAVAFNTRAAAKLDAGNVPGANSDVRKAWGIEQSAYVANTFTRVLMAEGQFDLALDMAKEAFRLDRSRPSAAALLKAAAKAEDPDALQEATGYLRTSEEAPSSDAAPDYWIELLAVDALIESGRLDEATTVIKTLEADSQAPQGRVKKAQAKLRKRFRARQASLDLDRQEPER